MDRPPHLTKSNELYDRMFKAIGEQPSNLQTHELICKIFNACMELAAHIGAAKSYAREEPKQIPRTMREAMQQVIGGPEIADDAVETVNVLFEGAISEVERHVSHG